MADSVSLEDMLDIIACECDHGYSDYTLRVTGGDFGSDHYSMYGCSVCAPVKQFIIGTEYHNVEVVPLPNGPIRPVPPK